jgi:hypothetical protein
MYFDYEMKFPEETLYGVIEAPSYQKAVDYLLEDKTPSSIKLEAWEGEYIFSFSREILREWRYMEER